MIKSLMTVDKLHDDPYENEADWSVCSATSPPYQTWVANNGDVCLECRRHANKVILRFIDLADFHLALPDLTVTCYPHSGIDAETCNHLFRNQVTPLLLNARGEQVFHGAAVAVPSGVMAFLGRSGLGKSTLATAFAGHGYPFLSDDVVQIGAASDGFVVQPGDTSVRLWGESRDWFFDRARDTAPAISYTRKSRIPAGDDLPHATTPQPLRAMFILTDEGATSLTIEPISGQAAHLAWVQHSFLLEPDKNAVIAANFRAAAELASSIPCFSLDYPRDFAQLTRLIDELIAFVGELPA